MNLFMKKCNTMNEDLQNYHKAMLSFIGTYLSEFNELNSKKEEHLREHLQLEVAKQEGCTMMNLINGDDKRDVKVCVDFSYSAVPYKVTIIGDLSDFPRTREKINDIFCGLFCNVEIKE